MPPVDNNDVDVEQKLKLGVFKRVKKLKKLRRRMRLWGVAGIMCAICASSPLVIFIFTGALPRISVDKFLDFSGDWGTVLGMIMVGLAGTMLFYRQFRFDKEKYDRIRAGAIALIQSGDPICDCKWTPCDCKDDLIRKMSAKHDINLSY